MSVWTPKALPYFTPKPAHISSLFKAMHLHAPPSRFAYSSSILSSYNLSAASSASVFCCGAVFVEGREAFDVGIELSVTVFGSMLEFEGASVDVKVGPVILAIWWVNLRCGLLWKYFGVFGCRERENSSELDKLYGPRDVADFRKCGADAWLCKL